MTATRPTAVTEPPGRLLVTEPPGRLLVDWTRCDGHGLCAVLAPDVVRADPWGYPIVTAAGDAATRRRLVALCPALALREETP